MWAPPAVIWRHGVVKELTELEKATLEAVLEASTYKMAAELLHKRYPDQDSKKVAQTMKRIRDRFRDAWQYINTIQGYKRRSEALARKLTVRSEIKTD